MKIVLRNKETGLTNIFNDDYIWAIVKSNLQYDNELEDYDYEIEDKEKDGE